MVATSWMVAAEEEALETVEEMEEEEVICEELEGLLGKQVSD